MPVAVTTACVSLALLVIAACAAPTPSRHDPDDTSSSGSSGKDGDDADKDAAPADGSSSGTSGSSANGTDAGDVDSPCLTKGAECSVCCTDVHATGSKAFDAALVKCICTAPAACKTECTASLCATPATRPAAGSPCDTCIRTALAAGGQCATQVDDDCKAVPDCPAVNACIGKCP